LHALAAALADRHPAADHHHPLADHGSRVMADTIVIAEEDAPDTGYRFSWGLAILGGVTAVAVTFFLLMLGSGFGLMLVRPQASSVPAFLTGGAIYFFAAQAFGFAVGGHLVGRLLGPIVESKSQEEFRAASHGFASWAVTVLATLALVALAGIAVANNSGMSAGALYGTMSAKTGESTPAGYLVDRLFRPGGPGGDAARGEALRILDAGLARGEQIAPDDRERLGAIVSRQAGLTRDAALARIDREQADVQAKTKHAADVARRTAAYASLWIALSLLFGAAVASFAAVLARNEDDRRL
jgi:hypothetical protein